MASVMWFRRDLRLAANPALMSASVTPPVVGLFVLDPRLLARAGGPRRRFLGEQLAALDRSMSGALVVRVGDPVDVVPTVAREVGAAVVWCTRDDTPYSRRRDDAVGAALAASERRLRAVGSPYLVAPGDVHKPDGSGYSVFTAYWRAWLRHDRVSASCGDPAWEPLASDRLDAALDDVPGVDLPPAGEDAAWRAWSEFRDGPLREYASGRDRLGVQGTSVMSPYLHWGVLHPGQLVADLDDSPAAEAFIRQLCWRDFYADVVSRHPAAAWQNLDRRYDALEVDTDERARQRFLAWQQGRTGYPIVDAGMRQLAATGWMHNRARMITASFLVKDLHLPWQWGARYFLEHLVDGDLASNNLGWQWVAGSGTDAAPYHRILSPSRQAERFDPDGAYVRRWLRDGGPASDRTSDPEPIVDHAAERVEALRRRRSIA